MSESIKIPTIDVKQYGGKQVAIVDGEIVATGRTWGEVLKKARKSHLEIPRSAISVLAVPKSIYLIPAYHTVHA